MFELVGIDTRSPKRRVVVLVRHVWWGGSSDLLAVIDQLIEGEARRVM